jgi:hypothetical protein
MCEYRFPYSNFKLMKEIYDEQGVEVEAEFGEDGGEGILETDENVIRN